MGCCNSNVTKKNKVKNSSLSKLVKENKRKNQARIEKPIYSPELSINEENENKEIDIAKMMVRKKTSVKKIEITKKKSLDETPIQEEIQPTMNIEEIISSRASSKKYLNDNKSDELPLDDLELELIREKHEERLMRKASLGGFSASKRSHRSSSLISQAKRLDTSEMEKDGIELEEKFALENEDFFDVVGYSDEEDLRRVSLEMGRSVNSRSLDEKPCSLDTSEDIIYKRAGELEKHKRFTQDGTLIIDSKKKKKLDLETENTNAIGIMTSNTGNSFNRKKALFYVKG